MYYLFLRFFPNMGEMDEFKMRNLMIEEEEAVRECMQPVCMYAVGKNKCYKLQTQQLLIKRLKKIKHISNGFRLFVRFEFSR